MKKILVTGGGGYVGSKLLATLVKCGHEVICIDAFWFGDYLERAVNLEIIKGDFRDNLDLVEGCDTVIHLANIANDPAVDLDPLLSWECNVLGARMLADACLSASVSQIIYASSGSVYGVSQSSNVVESSPLLPISAYNKTKMCAEAIFESYVAKGVVVHNIRPATVCGFSPRMRLDVAVNLLTFQALSRGKINVLGGSQSRPNIHIDDMVRVYEFFINNPKLPSGSYNAGFENISISDLALLISEIIPAQICYQESNDPRSYHQNSSKLLGLGFEPTKTVKNAVVELKDLYERGVLADRQDWHTMKAMKAMKLGIK